jgi:hypothetical protein
MQFIRLSFAFYIQLNVPTYMPYNSSDGTLDRLMSFKSGASLMGHPVFWCDYVKFCINIQFSLKRLCIV